MSSLPRGGRIAQMYSLGEIGCMVKELYCAPKKYTYAGMLYVLDDIPEGALVEYWQPEVHGGTAVPHDNPVNIFGAGLNAHPNAPSHTAILPTPSFSTASPANLALLGIESRDDTNGTDQIKMTTYPCALAPFTLIDTNTNTGERGAVLLNGALTEDNTDSVSADRAAYPPISTPAGVSSLEIATSDLSAWQGIAPAGGDGVTWFAEPPTWTPMAAFKCNDLSGGFVDCDGNPIEVGDKDYWGNPPVVNPICCSVGGSEVVLPQTLRIADNG